MGGNSSVRRNVFGGIVLNPNGMPPCGAIGGLYYGPHARRGCEPSPAARRGIRRHAARRGRAGPRPRGAGPPRDANRAARDPRRRSERPGGAAAQTAARSQPRPHPGRRLVIAGGWRPSFTGAVKYVGEVDGKRKAALLARARCLWNAAQWDEPFGLVTIEALFSGTPVLGTRRGALPETITPEVGALCDTLDEMLEAAEQIGTRDPAACRAHAERHFTHRVMAEAYVRMY